MDLTYSRENPDEIKTQGEKYFGSASETNKSAGLDYQAQTDSNGVSDDEYKDVNDDFKAQFTNNLEVGKLVLDEKGVEDEASRQPFYTPEPEQMVTPDITNFATDARSSLDSAPDDITEEQLRADPVFQQASQILSSFYKDRLPRGQEIRTKGAKQAEYGLQLGSEMLTNIGGVNVSGSQRSMGGLIPLVEQAISDGDENTLSALEYVMDMYDKKDMTVKGWQRGLKYLFGDGTNFMLGGLVSKGVQGATGNATKQIMKSRIRQRIAQIAQQPVAQAIVEGGAYTFADELERQRVKVASGGQTEIDLADLAIATGVGSLAGYGIVKVPESAVKNTKAFHKWLKESIEKDAFVAPDGTPISKEEWAGAGGGDAPQPSVSINVPFDEFLEEANQKELSAYMRNATPEEKTQIIEKMKSFSKKPKAIKAKEQILVQEEFNEQFYSRLEHEVSKIPSEKQFKTPTEAKDYLLKQGVKPKEIEASGVLEGWGDGKVTGEQLERRVDERNDRITKRVYDEDNAGSRKMEQDEWEDYLTTDYSVTSNSSDSGEATRITDEMGGMEIYIETRYNDEFYVDEYGDDIGDYAEMQEHWFENNVAESDEWYVNAKERYDEENVDSGATWDTDLTYEEQRDFVVTEAEDDAPWYEIYGSKVEYEVSYGGGGVQTFDDHDKAEEYAKEYLFEDYEYRSEEGAEIYEDYTVGGGDNYRLNLYQMDEFEAGAKETAREPHFGELEYGDENVQVHTRLKDRTDANGDEGTVVEEVQSQWEQDWRKTGGDVKPLTEAEVKELEAKKAPLQAELDKMHTNLSELQELATDKRLEASDLSNQMRADYMATKTDEAGEIHAKQEALRAELEDVNKVWMEETGDEYTIAKTRKNEIEMEQDILESEISVILKKAREAHIDNPKWNKLMEDAKLLTADADAVKRKAQEYYELNLRDLETKLNPKESTLATPPMQERTQYERVAILDELLIATQDGKKFFGWNNSGIQNGSRTGEAQREGMKNAYDLELPRIIQKETGKIPYKYYHDNTQNVLVDRGGVKEYWNYNYAKDLMYDEAEQWYWRIDLDDELTSKLNDSKINLYSVGGATLLGAGAMTEDEQGEQQ